jgi:signal transduction histidine kinase
MTTNIASLVLVGMNAEAAALAVAAAARAFPGAVVCAEATLEAALARPATPGTELLLLGQPEAAAVARAVAAVDARGLPRWPVVAFGPDFPGAVALATEDWNPRTAARILQAAAAAHALARENARLRGDLFTVGRRLSHDLRTPLMAIATASDAIRESAREDVASREGFAQSIAISSDEVSNLVDRISAVLKATAEPRAKEPVPMGIAVWAALQRLERRTIARGAAVAQPASWPTVQGVPAWLELIWWNFIANGLAQAGPAPRIELGWQEEAGGHRFWADDRGPGVPARLVGTLFQPFDLLHRPSAPRGWGLAMVQRLVELQGGRCGYEPRSGGGARFFFTLPG